MIKKLSWLVLTNIGRYALFFALILIGFYFADNSTSDSWYQIFSWIGWIGVAGISVQLLIFIVFAWIINPIREKKNENRPN